MKRKNNGEREERKLKNKSGAYAGDIQEAFRIIGIVFIWDHSFPTYDQVHLFATRS